MSASNVIVIILSMISLLLSICASWVAQMALKEEMKTRAKAKALETSRIEVSLKDIAIQMRALPKEHGQAVFLVKAKRTYQNTKSDRNSQLAV